jgi:hypothetical protein
MHSFYLSFDLSLKRKCLFLCHGNASPHFRVHCSTRRITHETNLDIFSHYFRECDVRHETELSLFKLTDYLAYKGGSGTEATQW